MSNATINWSDFEKIDIRVGIILRAEVFPEARKPAYKLTIDFGKELGIKKSSAQITDHYQPSGLIGRKIVAIINFPPKQIGPFISECLVLGSYQPDGSVVLLEAAASACEGAQVG